MDRRTTTNRKLIGISSVWSGKCGRVQQKLLIQMMHLMALWKSFFHLDKRTGIPFKLKMQFDFCGSSSKLLPSADESPVCACFEVEFYSVSLGCGVGRGWRRKSGCCPTAPLNMWIFHSPLDTRCRKCDLSLMHTMLQHLGSYLQESLSALSVASEYNARDVSKCASFSLKCCSLFP